MEVSLGYAGVAEQQQECAIKLIVGELLTYLMTKQRGRCTLRRWDCSSQLQFCQCLTRAAFSIVAVSQKGRCRRKVGAQRIILRYTVNEPDPVPGPECPELFGPRVGSSPPAVCSLYPACVYFQCFFKFCRVMRVPPGACAPFGAGHHPHPLALPPAPRGAPRARAPAPRPPTGGGKSLTQNPCRIL